METGTRSYGVKTPVSTVKKTQSSDTNTTKVTLTHLWDWESWLATHIYSKCLSKIWRIEWTYSCEELVRTFTKENGAWITNRKWRSTPDHGLCQLNIKWHKKFINSEDFNDPHKQLDYCLEVWIDAKNKGTMPRYWHKKYDKMYNSRQMYNRNKAVSFVKFY